MEMYDVEDIRREFKHQLKHEQFSDNGTLEIIACQFMADETTIFGSPDPGYIIRELDWYNAQTRDIFDMKSPIPRIWQQIASPHGQVNSNYGLIIYSTEYGSQYQNCLQQLNRDSNTRRAVMIYMDPHMHKLSMQNGMNDFVCTYAVQFFIRNRKLHCLVNMRSSDAIFGYKNDRPWHQHVHGQLLRDLKQKPINHDLTFGPMVWNAGSFHIYPQHFKLII